MGSDAAMANATVPAISKDFGKKKRANRSAKLKQCKLDARREQWLSQVKNKDCKVTGSHSAFSPALSPPVPLPRAGKKDCVLADDFRARSRGEEKEGLGDFQNGDLESPITSPISNVFVNNSLRKGGDPNSICSGAGSSSGSSSGSYSRSVSDADEEEGEGEEEGSLDDWEAVADALSTSDDLHLRPKSDHDSKSVESIALPEIRDEDRGSGILKKPELMAPVPRAWRPDDEFRPQSLPNLSKQRSFPVNLERHHGNGTIGWAHHGLASQPSSCPICYEDLDLTDSSFLPCSCGFRLCLFCHKKILEVDGRCPGCRKQYSSVVGEEMAADGRGLSLFPLRLARSCSMSS